MRISVILLVIMVLLAYIAQAGDVELEVEVRSRESPSAMLRSDAGDG